MRKFVTLLIIFVTLLGCSTSKIDNITYDDWPTFQLTDQQFETNLKSYAATIGLDYINSYHWKHKADLFEIGDRIPVYGYENGELVQQYSPYYFPLFLEGKLKMIVEIYNGENSTYVPLYFGGYNINFENVPTDNFYWRVSEYSLDDNGQLTNGFFIVQTLGDAGMYFYTDTDCLTRYSRKQLDITKEQITTILDSLNDYKIDNLQTFVESIKTNDKIYILNNQTSEEIIKENKTLLEQQFKEYANVMNISYKKIKIGDPFNSFLYITNIDLSTSFIKDCDYDLIYPIYLDNKYYTDGCVYTGGYASFQNTGLTVHDYEKLCSNTDFILIHDYTGYCELVLTNNEIFTTKANYFKEDIIKELQEKLFH